MAGPRTKGKHPKNPPALEPMPLGASAEEVHRNKVDDAFELMEKIDGNPTADYAENPTGRQKPAEKARKGLQSGLRIRFGVDAMISDSDIRAARQSDLRPGEATLFDLGITLPYIWQLPVVGKKVLKLVKHFQKEDGPRTVRDILKSLLQKSE